MKKPVPPNHANDYMKMAEMIDKTKPAATESPPAAAVGLDSQRLDHLAGKWERYRKGDAIIWPEDFDDTVAALRELQSSRRDAELMRNALLKAKRLHHICADPWYSCPKSEEGCADERKTDCNCGADQHNAAIDAAIQSRGGK